MSKKIISLILSVIMIFSMMPISMFSAFAADCVHEDADKNNKCDLCGVELYVDRTWNETDKTVVDTLKAIPSATEVTSGTKTLESGWYIVSNNISISGRITVNGTSSKPTYLILMDGCSLTAKQGIRLEDSSTLYVFGQSNDNGSLNATGSKNNAGIGGNVYATKGQRDSGSGGKLTVVGGTITATGGMDAAGIGGGCHSVIDRNHNGLCSGGIFTMYGGYVTASGGDSAAGIGGGDHGDGGNVTVYGGILNASGGSFGAGIGSGYESWITHGGTVTIYGGTVTATSKHYGAGIGGGDFSNGANFKYYGGSVTASGSKGIGAGDGETNNGEFYVAPLSHIKLGNGKAITAEEYKSSRNGYIHIHYAGETFEKYKDNGDGTHSRDCAVCGDFIFPQEHTFEGCCCKLCYSDWIGLHEDINKDSICDKCRKELYLERKLSDDNETVIEVYKFIPEATVITPDTKQLDAGKWYVAESFTELKERIKVNGTSENPTHIILKDFCELKAKYGIELSEGNELRVYGQVNETGKLFADCSEASGNSAIGGNDGCAGGSLVVFGGNITAQSGTVAAGIGGGRNGDGGSFAMYGGSVTAMGSQSIGSGSGVNSGKLTLYGEYELKVSNSMYGYQYNSSVDIFESSRHPYASITYHTHVFISKFEPTPNGTHGHKCLTCGIFKDIDFHVLGDNNSCKICGETLNSTDFFLGRIWNEDANEVEKMYNAFPPNVLKITADTTVLEAGKVYVASGTVTIDERIEVNGTPENPTHLILMDDCNLTCNNGIHLADEDTLYIYGQTEETGKLSCNNSSSDRMSALGGNIYEKGGNLTLYSGNIYSYTYLYAAGIGGGDNADGGNFTIYGGTTEAVGGFNAAAIGGGWYGNGGSFTMYGGYVKARNSIGGGSSAGNSGTITIKGDVEKISDSPVIYQERTHTFTGEYRIDADGTHSQMCSVCNEFVNAKPHTLSYSTDNGTHTAICDFCDYSKTENHTYTDGLCVCGKVKYIDHSWNAQRNEIVSTEKETLTLPVAVSSDTIDLTDGWYYVTGEVNVTERMTVSGIVNLILCDNSILNALSGININKGGTFNVYASSDDINSGILNASGPYETSAIGGEQFASDIKMNIFGGRINAIGGYQGAGIGGDLMNSGIDVTVYAGKVRAYGGLNAAGIGTGKGYSKASLNGGTLTIYNGDVIAVGGEGGAGIGGGFSSDGADFTMYGGSVKATGRDDAVGIGAGNIYRDHRSFTVNNLEIIRSGDCSADTETTVESYSSDRTHSVYIKAHSHRFVNYVCECGADSLHNFTGSSKDNGDGTHSYKCTRCGEYGATVSHTFVNFVCECGAEDTAGQLTKAKEDAIAELKTYNNDLTSDIVYAAISEIKNAESIAEVDSIKAQALEDIANAVERERILQEAIAEAIAEVRAAAEKVADEIDPNGVEYMCLYLGTVTSLEELEEAKTEALDTLAAILELKNARLSAIDEINAKKTNASYAIAEKAIADINAADTIESIIEIKTKALADMKKADEDAAAAKALADAKIAAIAEINNAKTEANKAIAEKAIADINAASTVDAVNSIKTKALSDMADNPTEPEDPSKTCGHLCHKSGFLGFIWKIANFFNKLFKINKTCSCGAGHY